MCRSREGDKGVQAPSEKLQKIRVYNNTGQDPLKIINLPIQLSMYGHNWHGSETPFDAVSLAG